MTRKSWVVALLAAVVFGIGGYAVGAFIQGTSSSRNTEEANWLFSQTANSGSITPQDDGTWILELSDIDPNVIGFTDRPFREAQVGNVEKLIEAWPAMFADSDPNGVVVAHNAEGETNSAVVQLMDPQIDGSTLRFTVRVLTNEGGPTEPGATYSFEQVSLFIDDVGVSSWVCTSPEGGVVDPPGAVDAPVVPAVWRSQCEINGGFPIPQKS